MKTKTIVLSVVASALPALCIANNKLNMVIGTYTDNGSKGVYSFLFDQQTGKATAQHSLALKNPSYLAFAPNGRYFYAVSENNDTTASLNAIAFDRDGSMKLVNTQRTHDEDPCYVETDGHVVMTANYSGGSLSVFPIAADGSLKPMASQHKGTIGGPDLTRQDKPHVHCTRFTKDGYMLATNFSADQILSFKYNKTAGTLTPYSMPVDIDKESGPRHLTFSPNGKDVYLMSELSGDITAFHYANGLLKRFQTIAADDAKARGGADIHLSPDGKFVYASTRLKGDGITIFKRLASGKLVRVGQQPTGLHPRNFIITPNGKFVLVACRDANKIQVYARNPQTGLLSDTHQDILVQHPVCVKFAPAQHQ